MQYYKLQLDEFFDPKYEKLNHSDGIGGMGIITSKQSIHVYNDYEFDKKTHKEYLGLGSHYEKTCQIVEDIYDINRCLVDVYLYQLIQIKYWNSDLFNIIAFFFPKTITKEEYERVVALQEYYEEIFNKYRITVAAYQFGDDIRNSESYFQKESKLEHIIKYASDRVDPTLVRTKKEKILKY